MHYVADSDHIEDHFESTELVRDVVIGMSDGLTVPFALAAGLSGAVGSSHIVVLAGLAEIAAGSIAMGLGGYLAARSDVEHYASERRREEKEIVERTRDEEEEIYQIFEEYGVTRTESDSVLLALKRNPKAWVDFMMRFELGPGKTGKLSGPAKRRGHCFFLYCRWIYPLNPLYAAASLVSAACVGRHHIDCALLFWRSQGPPHRWRHLEVCIANGFDRWSGCGCRIYPCQAAQRAS